MKPAVVLCNEILKNFGVEQLFVLCRKRQVNNECISYSQGQVELNCLFTRKYILCCFVFTHMVLQQPLGLKFYFSSPKL